jgi:hypothetical protein
MKQKMICLVLVVIAMYLQASPKECAKICSHMATESGSQTTKKAVEETKEEAALPVSPLSRMVFNL